MTSIAVSGNNNCKTEHLLVSWEKLGLRFKGGLPIPSEKTDLLKSIGNEGQNWVWGRGGSRGINGINWNAFLVN